MLSLYSTEQRYVARITASLDRGSTVVATDRWDQFELAAPRATCSIAVVEWLLTSPVLAQLKAIKSRGRLHAVVLVTGKDADNARALRHIPVEEVVFIPEIEDSLRQAVRRATAEGLLERVAHAVQQAGRLSPLLRASLAYACRSDTPVRSIIELAAACGRDRRTLWRHWRSAPAARQLRLEDVIDWLLLLHAASRKAPERSWSRVAWELKVHHHTLARTAVRLLGQSLTTLATADPLEVAAWFGARVLTPLLGTEARDALGEPGAERPFEPPRRPATTRDVLRLRLRTRPSRLGRASSDSAFTRGPGVTSP